MWAGAQWRAHHRCHRDLRARRCLTGRTPPRGTPNKQGFSGASKSEASKRQAKNILVRRPLCLLCLLCLLRLL